MPPTSTLAFRIGVTHQASQIGDAFLAAGEDRMLESVEDQRGLHRPRRSSADDPTREGVDHGRDVVGTVTLRHNGRLHHIGIGQTPVGTYVRLLVQDLQITVITAATGEVLRELALDPTRDYQPTGAPNGPTKQTGPTTS